MTSLTLQDVAFAYGPDAPAVRGLQLNVADGERLVLLGPSGCGKTTTLRLIAGLEQPDGGDILFDGRSVVGLPPEKRGAVMVFQSNALFPFRTVEQNVAYGLKLRKVAKRERQDRVAEALAAVQLDGLGHRWPGELSGGQQQRAALARALVVRPQVLLLDEPLSSLDPDLRDELQQTICRLQEELAITTVVVTHDRAEARALADRVAVMDDGAVTMTGAADDVVAMAASGVGTDQSEQEHRP